MNNTKQKRINWLSLVGILSALTAILYLIRVPVILFLEINFSEVVIFIGGFSLGPLAALTLSLFRFLFALPFTTTGVIGEFADLLYTLAFVLPGAILYQSQRTKKMATIGFLVGMVLQLMLTSLLNALVITDLYLRLFLNTTPEAFVAFIQGTIPQVENPYWSLVLWMYLPFNTLKNTVIIIVTLLTYKRVHKLIKKLR